jgi:hypothetical protein
MSDSPDAFGSTYERELARTTLDWQRWLSPGSRSFWNTLGVPSHRRRTARSDRSSRRSFDGDVGASRGSRSGGADTLVALWSSGPRPRRDESSASMSSSRTFARHGFMSGTAFVRAERRPRAKKMAASKCGCSWRSMR